MTRKEAIRLLKTYRNCLFGILTEPIDMAIKALEQEPCENCIRRQEVFDLINDQKDVFYSEGDRSLFESYVSELSPVTPPQKTGHWISHYDEDEKVGWYECDRCHTERAFNTKFCPDCGAKMVEPQEERDKE